MNLRQCRNGNCDVRNNHQVAGSRGLKRSLYQHLTTGPVQNRLRVHPITTSPAPPNACEPIHPAQVLPCAICSGTVQWSRTTITARNCSDVTGLFTMNFLFHFQIFPAPGRYCVKNRKNRFSEFCETIINPWGNFRVHRPDYDSVGFEFAKIFRQSDLGNAGNISLEFSEPERTLPEIPENLRFPFSANHGYINVD